ncbi:unnamed protein product, partial [Closterium sp. NIES-54]
MMEKFFSFMSFYEQHQQAAPAQSNNSDINNRATPMRLDGSSYARGNQQQPTFAPYEPQRGSISFAPQPQSSPGQEKTLDALQTLYDAVVARYSSPATAALSRLMLPYLFPDLAAFPTVADLITHLRTSDTRYRTALLAEFCARNPPPMYITLYYIVTQLPDSLRLVRDHFLL